MFTVAPAFITPTSMIFIHADLMESAGAEAETLTTSTIGTPARLMVDTTVI